MTAGTSPSERPDPVPSGLPVATDMVRQATSSGLTVAAWETPARWRGVCSSPGSCSGPATECRHRRIGFGLVSGRLSSSLMSKRAWDRPREAGEVHVHVGVTLPPGNIS